MLVNPLDDQTFRRRAFEALDRAVTPEDLATSLRDPYPKVVVRTRQLQGELYEVWYVYRDGRWVGSNREERDD